MELMTQFVIVYSDNTSKNKQAEFINAGNVDDVRKYANRRYRNYDYIATRESYNKQKIRESKNG